MPSGGSNMKLHPTDALSVRKCPYIIPGEGQETMTGTTPSERIASERPSSLESPTRRLLMKGLAGLGATLVSSSLSEAISAQTHQPGAPGNQVPPDQVGWG